MIYIAFGFLACMFGAWTLAAWLLHRQNHQGRV